MGCNCKNKTQNMPSKIRTQQVENTMVIPNQTAPDYTWEEVIQVKDYLGSKIKTAEGQKNLFEFNEKYFGEKMVGYCDIPCMTRVRKRVELATQRLQEWDTLNKN